MAFGTVLRQSYLAKMYFVGKKNNIGAKPMRIWIGNIAFFHTNLRMCDFIICKKNLRAHLC
jgi:hypothetical protein